ncbi:MAG: ATP-binding protein [Bacteroidota bacterium]|nr:ATP-binding protein [Bacteroidota bacterium]
MHFRYKIEGGDFTNAGSTASAVKKVLKQLNIDPVIIKRTVVGIYEAEVNIVAHAYNGVIDVDIDENRIFARFEDAGPGIPDITKAMEEGYSTASEIVREMGFGAGMGLSNIKNNSDKLEIISQVGKGTTVEITNYFNSK